MTISDQLLKGKMAGSSKPYHVAHWRVLAQRLRFRPDHSWHPLSPTQHGFRAKHSTTTFLTTLTQHIHERLNAPKLAHRTLLARINIIKAFDTVWQYQEHYPYRKSTDTTLTHTTRSGCLPSLHVDTPTQSTAAHHKQKDAPQCSAIKFDRLSDPFQPLHERHTNPITASHKHTLLYRRHHNLLWTPELIHRRHPATRLH